MSATRRIAHALTVVAVLLASTASAHLGPIPVTLKGVSVPATPGLLDGPAPIIVNKQKAIALGKALFWDMNVGSDGVACATCHFSAGADGRTRNQRAPTGKFPRLVDERFSARPDGTANGVNGTLKRRDFPTTRFDTPLTEDAVPSAESDDSIGSAGVFKGIFKGVELDQTGKDLCDRGVDAVFHVGSVGTRQVERRNAPSVINAAFNHRQLWDGAASARFNGVNQWGTRDANAGVWVRKPDGRVVREKLLLDNASLASQAVSVPVNSEEMACAGRALPDLARKLLLRRPLESQHVHWNDSVLGGLAQARPGKPARGLRTHYLKLIRETFDSRYWGDLNRDAVRYGAPAPNTSDPDPYAYNQLEANFGLFFGLALQLYQQTLISDDSPFDRSRQAPDGTPLDLSQSAQRGLQVFREGHCNLCHVGPHFTSAAVASNALLVKANPLAFGEESVTVATSGNVVTRQLASGVTGFVDTGFAATSVGRDEWDPGLAGRDAWGRPLSFSEQYLDYLAGYPEKVVDAEVAEVRACDLQSALALNVDASLPRVFTRKQGVRAQPQSSEGCLSSAFAFVPTVAAARAELESSTNQRMRVVIQSAFKIPNLRNVELTGPYMHNGSMATLDEVVAFYTRGGNFRGMAKQTALVFGQPQLEFDAGARADLIEFLKSLTDERVRYARAPFDHPELRVPDGHIGDTLVVQTGNAIEPLLAQDRWITVQEVGAEGRATPLQEFVDRLEP